MVFTLFSIAAVAAFPGAQGGGALSKGGRGGRVYLIANLNDSGPGSLRACVAASGPRTCVFRTGGTIALLSTLRADNPFPPIAGPAAPDGMTDLDFHHDLFAGTSHRMPLLTVKSARLVNNLVYAWTYYPMRGKGLRDFIGNVFKTRTGQTAASHEIQAWTEDARNDTSLSPSFYVSGNIGPSDPNGSDNWAMTALARNESAGEASSPLPAKYRRSAPMPAPAIPITAEPAATLSSTLLGDVGASRKLDCNGRWVDALDPVDRRIVKAVADGTNLHGSYDYSSLRGSPQSQADLGGWPTLAAGTPCADAGGNSLPDAWESHWARVFGHRIEPSGVDFADGYTNLEHYIDGMSPSP